MKRMVVIKSWKQMEKDFGVDSNGNIRCKFCFTPRMEELMPIHRHIEIRGENVWLTEAGDCHISEDMILGPALKPGAPVEARDGDGQEWIPCEFAGYSFAPDGFRYITNSYDWKQMRVPPTESEIEVIVKINGKPVKPSEISEETWAHIRTAEQGE
jgi:hypothetical protein